MATLGPHLAQRINGRPAPHGSQQPLGPAGNRPVSVPEGLNQRGHVVRVDQLARQGTRQHPGEHVQEDGLLCHVPCFGDEPRQPRVTPLRPGGAQDIDGALIRQ